MTNSTSALLINEEPLQVLPTLAILVGFNESVVLQQLHYWLRKPRIGTVRDGRKWVFNSYGAWRDENFPFWSVDTVERAFRSLEKQRVVLSQTPGGRDRKKWYAIDYDRLEELRAEAHARALQSEEDTHTHPETGGAPTPQDALMHPRRLPLSDSANCGHASPQNAPMEDGSLPPPSPQSAPVLNKVSETTSETTQRTHTHDTREDPHAAAGVSVSDEVSEDDYYQFARSQPSFHTPDAWAATHWEKRDRDKVVADWKQSQRPEVAEARRAAPRNSKMSYGAARDHVRSVSSVGAGTDLLAVIGRLDVEPDVRERLVEEFCPARPHAAA